MRRARGWIGLFLGVLGLALLWEGRQLGGAAQPAELERMRKVEFVIAAAETPAPAVHLPKPRQTALPSAAPTPLPSPAPDPKPAPVAEEAYPEEPPDSTPLPDGSEIRPTAISGGLSIKNETAYEPDIEAMLSAGPPLQLPAEGPQILIIHTHSSEAYTPAGLDRYDASDVNRTEDERYNIIRIGDELCEIYAAAGLQVIHDRGIYDYPSYTGSYGRSAAAIEQYLTDYPGIAVVFDIHRDALGGEGVVYKIMAEESGTVASQLMLLCGTDESGLEHPGWRSNLALALYLQAAVDPLYPTLMRPVALVPQRYNQHLTGGSLILEVGSSGNTLQEALAAIRLFGEATAPALLALAEP